MEPIEIIKRLVKYDQSTGSLTFREATPEFFSDGSRSKESICANWNSRNAGKPAFSVVHIEGYLCGMVLGRRYLAHRVAWLLAKGAWPKDEIDHKNHDRTDNRLKNLRAVTRAENAKNLGMYAANKSGCTGVYWFEPTKKWLVKISVKGRVKHIGYFKELSDAIAARVEAQAKFGFHKNHGEKF
tara:strand:+ start:201 stop:752 length:552 start_codon:yes stop_codon:yes gene_type:complete